MLLNEEKWDSPADGHRLRTLKTIAATFAVLGAVTVSGVVAFIYSGSIDVTATNPHWEITHRVLLEIREQSIKRQARDVTQFRCRLVEAEISDSPPPGLQR